MRGYLDFENYKDYLKYWFPYHREVIILTENEWEKLKHQQREINLLKIKFTKNTKINYKIILK